MGLVFATLTAVAMVWTGLVYHLQSRQEAIREQTHHDVMNLSIGVEKHVERLLAGVDQVMRFVAEDFKNEPETFNFSAWLRRSTSLEDVATQVSIFNEEGELLASRTPMAPGLPNFNIRDRAYFQALAARPDLGLYVDRTLKGRITGRNSLQTARRLDHHDGSFAGVIVTSIDPNYLSSQFKAVDVGVQGSIGLFGHDGYIRARYPQSEGMYEQNVTSLNTGKGVFAHLKERPSGTYEVESAFDHVTRVFGYRTVGSLPLIVTVGKSLDEVMLPLQNEQRRAILVGFAITALLFALLLLRLHALGRDRRYAVVLAEANRTLSEKDKVTRAAEAHYRVLAENTSELIMLGHDNGSRSYISPASERLLGFTPKELAAMSLRDYVHPEDLADLFATTRRLSRGEGQVTCVYRALTKRGVWIWVEGIFRRIPEARGDEASIVATFRDITERKEQACLLEEATTQAKAASAAKDEFLASMSHELRTPLNAIIGFSGLMVEGDGLTTPMMQRYARLVQDASTTLLSIVNDVLDVSKLEAGDFELDPHPFSPRDLIESSAALLRDQANSKRLVLHVETDPSVPDCLLGDEARLRQVLLNLLSNAVKFTAKGMVWLFVACEEEAEGQARIRFTVMDTGIGIPQDKRHRLFKRFSQVDGSTARQFGGTGLGLSICKSLVGLMGGSIDVDSVEGEGTAFSFMLDLPVAEAVTTPEQDLPASPVRSVHPAHILLAEDVALNQELAVAMLTKWGHTVEVVSDGAAAVDAVMRNRYDLVLMDVQMPVMDGIDAMRRIRGLGGAFTTLPIIAMTANVMARDIELCMKAGADGHVGKPFAPKKLRSIVEHWTDARTRQTQADEAVLVQTPGHDSATLDDLRDMVGPDTTISIVGKFVADLDRRLSGEPNDMSGWQDIKNDAHALVSTAGLLGFGRLSEACRTLEEICASAPFDEKAAQAQLKLVRNEVAWSKAEAMLLQLAAPQAA